MWLSKYIFVVIIMVILLPIFHISLCQENEESVIFRCAVEMMRTTNPLIDDEASWRILNLVYEGATKYNPDTGLLLPYIAVGSANESHNSSNITWEDCLSGNFGYSPKEVWKDSNKPEIIVFYDFESVYWHDDVQMSIRDIMFSFHAQATSQYSWLGHPLKDLAGKDHGNYSETQWLSMYKIWEAENGSKAALRFVLQKPYFSVFEHYLSLPILPYHIWGSRISGQNVDYAKIWCDTNYNTSNLSSWQPSIASSWANTWPVGSGPFMWDGIEEDRIALIAWTKHFYRPGYRYDTQASQPNIDEISFRFYDYEEKAIMDLENDKIDYIAWTLHSSKINQLANNPDLTIKFLKGAGIVHIAYNMRSKSFGYDNVRWQQFSSEDTGKPLRRAIAHCVDTMTIKTLTNFVPHGENLGLYYEWKNTTSPRYAFDLSEATLILKKAGYYLENLSLSPGNGNWWLNPDGSTIGSSLDGTIELLISKQEQDPMMFQVGTLLVNHMREIGINIVLTPLENDELWMRVFNSEFDMCILEQNFQTRTSVPLQSGDNEESSYHHPPS